MSKATDAERRYADAVINEYRDRGYVAIQEVHDFDALAARLSPEDVRTVERLGGIPTFVQDPTPDERLEAHRAVCRHRLSAEDVRLITHPRQAKLSEEWREKLSAEWHTDWQAKPRRERLWISTRKRLFGLQYFVPARVWCFFGRHFWVPECETNIVGDTVTTGRDICPDCGVTRDLKEVDRGSTTEDEGGK